MIPSLFDRDQLLPPHMKEIKAFDNHHVHNFSYHSLDCYLRLSEMQKGRQLFFISPSIIHLIPRHGKEKVYVFSYNDEDLSKLQKRAIIYSINQLPLKKENKQTEICYDFNLVFSHDSYPNSKKRYQRIVYPFNWCSKHNIKTQIITKYSKEIENIHAHWVDLKLKDPKVFKIMFSSSRYLYTIKHALNYPDLYTVYGVYLDTKLIAIRVVGFDNDIAYDLAFFGMFDSLPSQAMNYIDTILLKKVYDSGIRFFNCGSALNSNLKKFKTHYPYFEKIHYHYSKL